MNLLLLERRKVKSDGTAMVEGRQAKHMVEILKLKVGGSLRVGVDNLWVGEAVVLSYSVEKTEGSKKGTPRARVQLLHSDQQRRVQQVPNTLEGEANAVKIAACEGRPLIRTSQIDLIVALPRPKTLEKVLQVAATLGVGRLDVAAATRTELSYFSSPKMNRDFIVESLRLGLEQSACDPFFPEVNVFASWKSLLQDLEKRSTKNQKRIVFHPPEEQEKAHSLVDKELGLSEYKGTVLLAFGPEGGFINREAIELVKSFEFKMCHIGSRILRVEQAVTAAIAQTQLVLGLPKNPIFDSESSVSERSDLKHFRGKCCWCQPSSERDEADSSCCDDIVVNLPQRYRPTEDVQ